MERTLLSLCRPIQGAHIRPTGDSGIYLTKGDNPDDIYFRTVEFWIQAHDCLPGFVSKVLVRNLCNGMGSFLDVNEIIELLKITGDAGNKGCSRVAERDEGCGMTTGQFSE
ncbi:hypothetical protein Goshw_018904 [Gossypium schwendimanii]|uniref:DUF4283 domain-containing protein n=1 Tax=Gossypium schwendimanii TaxID=34291 RepID=A0A7J9KTJ2_GOSSC|nr:hypothetical protein [Gossypium schwendimanii]